MSGDAISHLVNVTRCIRTTEYAMKYNNDALKDPNFSYRSDIITTSLYCACNDCIKFCCYGKPIKCIDPYLMDMKSTHWIYNFVTTSKTASTHIDPNASTSDDPSSSDEEPKQKRRKY